MVRVLGWTAWRYGDWMRALHHRAKVPADFSPAQFTALQRVKFIPTKTTNGAATLLSPKDVYFGSAIKREHLSQLFLYVDFGPRPNTFLRSCGVSDEPTIDEVTWLSPDA